MKIKESIKVLKQLKIDAETFWKPKHNEPAKALSHAIKWGENISQSLDEMPEKKENVDCFKKGGSISEFRRGFNSLHDLLSPLFGKMKGRIKELEKQVKLRIINDESVFEIAKDILSGRTDKEYSYFAKELSERFGSLDKAIILQQKLEAAEKSGWEVINQRSILEEKVEEVEKSNEILKNNEQVLTKIKDELEKQVELLRDKDCISHCQEVAILRKELDEANIEIPKRPCDKRLAFDRGWLCFKAEITPIIAKKNLRIEKLEGVIKECNTTARNAIIRNEKYFDKLRLLQQKLETEEKELKEQLSINKILAEDYHKLKEKLMIKNLTRIQNKYISDVAASLDTGNKPEYGSLVEAIVGGLGE